ncbi:hypothetical protein EG328_009543 [Venturia inaequalis]|uniref:Uncharacterized protein n=1 Tax=Venturia inaequalis TaxID=5025 RepID=A0A8H3V9R1_VENIN|nr:hypothetical protein EG328_009543 [Venturia inaequalis]
MDMPWSRQIKELLDDISASSASARLDPRATRHFCGLLNDQDFKPRNNKNITTDTPSSLPQLALHTAKEMPIPALGTFSRLPPELRLMVYRDLAQDSTKAHNERKSMSKITNKGSLPPGLLLASKTAREEFEPYYQKEAWPTIIYTPEAGVDQRPHIESCCILEELLKNILPSNKRLPKFSIVLSSMRDGGRVCEVCHVAGLILDLIYKRRDADLDLDPDKNIERIRVIWYVQSWETMRRLEFKENELNVGLSRAWHFLLEADEHLRAQFGGVQRFPSLKNLEVCVRYKEDHYTYQYTVQDGKAEADTLIVPLATRYRDDGEWVASTVSGMIERNKAVFWASVRIFCGLAILILIHIA